VFSLQGKDASKLAGNWFQLLMVLFTSICSLFPSPNFPIMIAPYSDRMVLEVYFLLLSNPVPRYMPWKGRIIWLPIFTVPKFPNPTHFYYLRIYPLSFAPDLKRLPDLCMGPNTPLHTQVSVSLMPYTLNVSYYYFPFWVYALWNEVLSMLFVGCNWHDPPRLLRIIIPRYS